MSRTLPVEILIIEDNPADAWLTRDLLLQASVQNHLSITADGDEAMAFLRRQGLHADAPRPDLILLDLNLPRKNGLQVLAEIKAELSFQRIPVVVLTTSEAEADVLAAYDLHANAYMVKPVDLEQFVKSVACMAEFWLYAARLPGR
jgi:chemotaxis family two-component system response regulator Rcp1